MALKPNFLHNEFKRKISRPKIIIGILVGLLAAFFFYQLQFVFREIIRLFSLNDEYDLAILTIEERNYYNLIFAYIATIFGQSTCFLIWFNLPKSKLKLRATRLQNIVHEQRFLIWNFINWFAKLATLFGLTFYAISFGWYNTFSFYPKFNYLFILILIVLFLQSWNSILLVYKIKAYKWMLLSSLVISLIAFSFSKIEIFSLDKLDKQIVAKRINSRFQIELPTSSFYQKPLRYNWLPKVSVVYLKNAGHKDVPIYLFGEDICSLKCLAVKILEINPIRNRYGNGDQHIQYYQIDRNVPMIIVENLRKELSNIDVHWFYYMVIPLDAESDDFRYFSNEVVYLSGENKHASFFSGLVEKAYSNSITIRKTKGEIMINDTLVNKAHFSELLFEKITENKDYILNFSYNPSMPYGEYIEIYGLLKGSINSYREELSLKKYGKAFDTLEQEEHRIVIDEYPFWYNEIMEE